MEFLMKVPEAKNEWLKIQKLDVALGLLTLTLFMLALVYNFNWFLAIALLLRYPVAIAMGWWNGQRLYKKYEKQAEKIERELTVYAICALGPNDLTIPCLFFRKFTDAKEYLGEAGCTWSNKWGAYMVPENIPSWYKDENGDTVFPFWNKFFTWYYGGCGEVYGFSIKPIPAETPTIRWDLD